MLVAPEDGLEDVFAIYPNVVCVKLMKVSVYRQNRTNEDDDREDIVLIKNGKGITRITFKTRQKIVEISI